MCFFKIEVSNTFNFHLIVIGFLILLSCGGVVGNIKKYKLNNCTEKHIVLAINELYKYNPELIKNDTLLYGTNDDENYYFKLKHDKFTYIFNCHIVKEKNNVPIELSLTGATKYGDVMKLATELTFNEKILYIELFERKIFPKIIQHLKCY
jgi:hypothetical protein